MNEVKKWLTGSCVVATIILSCILPALAVLSFAGFAAFMIYCKEK